jgi:FixJ family two-component response regulator
MIVLVEDDAPVRHSVKLLLSMRNHKVRDCESAEQALGLDLSGRQTCLIADYVLPEMDGIRLLCAFRERGWQAPAVMITGVYHPTLAQRARDAGYDAIFEKPFAHDELADAVEMLAKGSPGTLHKRGR